MQRNRSSICFTVNHIWWTVLGVMLRSMSYQFVSGFDFSDCFLLSLSYSFSFFFSFFFRFTFASFYIYLFFICYYIFFRNSLVCWLIKYNRRIRWKLSLGIPTEMFGQNREQTRAYEPYHALQYCISYIVYSICGVYVYAKWPHNELKCA